VPLGRGEKGRLILLPKGALWGLDVDAGGLGAPGPSQLNAPGASATTPAGKITPAEERCQRFLPKSTVGIRTVTRCQGGNAKTFWRFVTLHLCWVMAEVGETDLGRVELYADRSRTEPRTSLLDGRLTGLLLLTRPVLVKKLFRGQSVFAAGLPACIAAERCRVFAGRSRVATRGNGPWRRPSRLRGAGGSERCAGGAQAATREYDLRRPPSRLR